MPLSELLGAGRTRQVLDARWAVVWLCRSALLMSYPECGRVLHRPHNSAIAMYHSACRKVRERETTEIVTRHGLQPRPFRHAVGLVHYGLLANLQTNRTPERVLSLEVRLALDVAGEQADEFRSQWRDRA